MKTAYVKINVSISESRYDSSAPCEVILTLPVGVLSTLPIVTLTENLWQAALNEFAVEQEKEASLEREAAQEVKP